MGSFCRFWGCYIKPVVITDRGTKGAVRGGYGEGVGHRQRRRTRRSAAGWCGKCGGILIAGERSNGYFSAEKFEEGAVMASGTDEQQTDSSATRRRTRRSPWKILFLSVMTVVALIVMAVLAFLSPFWWPIVTGQDRRLLCEATSDQFEARVYYYMGVFATQDCYLYVNYRDIEDDSQNMLLLTSDRHDSATVEFLTPRVIRLVLIDRMWDASGERRIPVRYDTICCDLHTVPLPSQLESEYDLR